MTDQILDISREEVAERLRKAIFDKPAMTITQAAKESGVSARTITGIIRGAVPSYITAKKLMKLWSKP